jgi:hypothetical protein
VQGALKDVRHALRLYLRTPVASAIAVFALAVAIAFVSAFLSLWNDLALQPHPGFEDSGELVTVAMSNGDIMAGTSIALMEDISENVSLVEGVATDQRYFATLLIGSERVDGVPAETVVRRYFPLLRPRMHLGRGFEPPDHEPDAEPVVVIGYDFWQRHFDGRRNAIGEQIGLEIRRFSGGFVSGIVSFSSGGSAEPETSVYQYRIVGVLAPGMKGTFQAATELYFPFEQLGSLQQSSSNDEPPNIADMYEAAAGLTGIGRLAQGATVEALQAELDRRYTPEAYPLIQSRAAQGMRLRAIPGVHLDLKARRDGLRQINLFLAGTVLLALVAACNATLFVLSRAPGRMRELAIRTSLGATRARLRRQLVSEAMLLVVPAVLAGVLVSLWLVVVLRDMDLFQTVRWRDVSPIDWRVLGILATFTGVLVALVSLAPALGLKRLNIGAASRAVSARAGLGQRLAGSIQLLAAAVLGSIAVAFGVQLGQYLFADPGFEMDDVIVARTAPTVFDLNQAVDFATVQLEEQRRREIVSALPGIEAVTFSNVVPGQLTGGGTSLPRAQVAPGSAFGDPEEQVQLSLVRSQPNFPALLGLRFAHGRSFSDDSPEGILVNESAARLLWGRTDVVGEAFGLFGQAGQPGSEVIGVVRDVHFGHPRDGLLPMVFMGSGSESGTMLLLTPHSPGTIRSMIAERAESGDVDVELENIVRLSSVWREIFATDVTRVLLTGSAALLTVLLAALGSYGTQRYVVTAGRREYAIRSALGAGPAAIGRLVVRRGIAMSLPALVFGALLAYLTVASLREEYFTESTSPAVVTVITIAALFFLVVIAIVGPASQARNTAPAPLLREE